MSIKDQALALAVALRALPALTMVKVLIILVKPSVGYWAGQVQAHQEAMTRYPRGSALHKQAESAYSASFDNWHRANFTLLSLNRALEFKSLSRLPGTQQQAA